MFCSGSGSVLMGSMSRTRPGPANRASSARCLILHRFRPHESDLTRCSHGRYRSTSSRGPRVSTSQPSSSDHAGLAERDAKLPEPPHGNRVVKHHAGFQYGIFVASYKAGTVGPIGWESRPDAVAECPVKHQVVACGRQFLPARLRRVARGDTGTHGLKHCVEGGEARVGGCPHLVGRRTDGQCAHLRRRVALHACANLQEHVVARLDRLALVRRVQHSRSGGRW